jgi:hypothetical protein
MEQTETQRTAFPEYSSKRPGPPDPFDETQFKPKGAIAFFVGLVLLCLLFWFGIYFLMLSRA